MTDITDTELAEIDAWCADALEKYGLPEKRIPIWAQTVCEYEDALPTHSIRSCVVSLVAALRSERTQHETRSRAYEECLDQLGAVQIELLRERTQNRELTAVYDEAAILLSCIYETHDAGETFPVRVSVATEHLRRAVAARAALSTQEESK